MKFLAIAYILLIYSTLSNMRTILNFLQAHISNSVLNIAVLCITAGLIVLGIVLALRRSSKITFGTLLSFGFYILVTYLYLSLFRRVEEKVHLFEYGILAVLLRESFFKISSSDGLVSGQDKVRRSYEYTLIVGFILGWIDEGIQYLLPNRVYDIRDVMMNFAGVLWGLWGHYLVFSNNPRAGVRGQFHAQD